MKGRGGGQTTYQVGDLITLSILGDAEGLSIAPTNATSHGEYLGVAILDNTAWVAWSDNTQSSDEELSPIPGPNPEADDCEGSTGVPRMDVYITRFPEASGPAPAAAGTAILVMLGARRQHLLYRSV
jgi:hypothetical protein